MLESAVTRAWFPSAASRKRDSRAVEVTADANVCFRVNCESNDANPQDSS